MSREHDDDDELSAWVQQKLAQLRRQIEAGEQPEGFERLLAELSQTESDQTLSEEALDTMFSLALDDALQGIDISVRYPRFYRQLLADSALREQFLDALEMLELSERGGLLPLPGPASSDLGFLDKQPQSQAVVEAEDDGWLVRWQRGLEQLQQLLFGGQSMELAAMRRSSELDFTQEPLSLLQDKLAVAGVPLSVHLEALPPEGESLHLRLWVTVPPDQLPGPLQATLHWGSYQATAPVSRLGQATFPPTSLDDILDGDHRQVIAPLELTLNTRPA